MGAPQLRLPRLEIGNELLQILEEAVRTTFQELFGSTVALKGTQTVSSPQPGREVSGIIGFVQDELEGVLSIGFPRDTLFKSLSPLYGVTLNSIDEKTVDGVGEITNTIFGIAKASFAKTGFKFQMCIPMVVIGEGYFIYSYQEIELVRMHFDSDMGEFWVEVFKTHI